MCFSILFRACFRLAVVPKLPCQPAICLPLLSACLGLSVFPLFLAVCFSALVSDYLFSPHFLAGYASPRAIFRIIYIFPRAFLPVNYFPTQSCRLSIFPRFLAGYVSSRAILRGYLFFPRYLADYIISRAFLSVICFPALSSRLCIGYVFSRDFLPVINFPALLAGYLFTRAFWRFRVMCFEHFLATSHWL